MAEFNVQNALAAVAMTYAQGVPLPVIRGALVGFTNSFEQNPGRLNVFDGHGFRVIVDYAHNPAGLSALCDLAWKLRSGYRRSIGMVSIPGDRREKDIREMGRIAAAGVFDELVFRERPDGRGRADGEVMRLLSEGAQEAGFPPERIHCIHDEAEAAIACLRMARPGDLVVLTPSSVEEIWQQVVGFDPTASPPVAEVAATAWG
ncbi:glutamate ligase domain-containing protein [Siccirubricoccus deserti]